MILNNINFPKYPEIGCDPELFLTKNGEIVGSELAIKENFINVVRDGVQIELHPYASPCRANLGNSIVHAFRNVKAQLKDEFGISIAQSSRIKARNLKPLGEDAKKFGCKPSYNTYTQETSKIDKIDASKHYQRSCGGHIHIGLNQYSDLRRSLQENKDKWIRVFDLFVGNTCVLIDTDPSNKTRRKLYGKAGDVRFPEWGLEYRTLSNFWLQSYELFSFVAGIARQAVEISLYAADEFLDLVKTKKIQSAINNNDFMKALDNFNRIIPFIKKCYPDNKGVYPLSYDILDEFMHFVYKGKDNYFKKDIIEEWVTRRELHEENGWESFSCLTLKEELKNYGQRVYT